VLGKIRVAGHCWDADEATGCGREQHQRHGDGAPVNDAGRATDSDLGCPWVQMRCLAQAGAAGNGGGVTCPVLVPWQLLPGLEDRERW